MASTVRDVMSTPSKKYTVKTNYMGSPSGSFKMQGPKPKVKNIVSKAL